MGPAADCTLLTRAKDGLQSSAHNDGKSRAPEDRGYDNKIFNLEAAEGLRTRQQQFCCLVSFCLFMLPFPVFLAPRVPRPNVFWLATCGALARAPGFFRQRLRVLASNPIETSTWGGPETGPRRGSWRSSTKRRCECGDVLPGLESGDLASLASGSPGLGAVCGRAGGAVLNCTPRPNAVVLWSIQTDSVPPN